MDSTGEKALVEQAQQDPEAFGILFDRYYDKIFNYILKRIGDIEIAEDLAAEVFYKALKKLWQFRWKKVSFGAWLYTIANNQIIDWYRRKKSLSLDRLRAETGFDLEDWRRCDKELVEMEQQQLRAEIDTVKIRSYLTELPAHYQEVLALRFFEQKPILEICEIIGKKEGTVKSLLSRGVAKLRVIVEKYHPLQPF